MYMYWHGTGRVSNFLNRLLLEVRSFALGIIVITFLCKVEIFPNLPQKIIPYFIME